MADRKCSFCGQCYTDETGHDYDACVKRCEESVKLAKTRFEIVLRDLEEAKKVQAQDWWRTKLARGANG